MPVIKNLFLLVLLLGFHFALAQSVPHTYYVSPGGNDNNNGLSPAHSWKSLDKINSHRFAPGDKVLLEGGRKFEGNITIDSSDNGTSAQPVVFSSYGKGKAIIDAKDKTAFFGYNCSGITVTGIIARGSGVGSNNGSGIYFYCDSRTNQCKNIRIDHCHAEGFQQFGIYFGASEEEDIKGYDDIHIEHCTVTANGEAGIASSAGQTKFHHKNFYIAHCKAYGNKGIPSKTQNHSGNGIVMGQVENLLIEHCEAYENGADNRCTAGGPVGIWVWLCKNAVIQYCESHHNHAGLTKDGGGFDIDGGAVDCIIQCNYSHDNEGAGYLLAEYGAGLPFTHNIIRFNISQNDGRKNGYGAITIWGADSNYKVRNSLVYNNTVYINTKNIVNGVPCAVQLMGPNLAGVLIANNIFTVTGGAEMINSSDWIDTTAVRFISNNYVAYDNNLIFKWGSGNYHSLQSWQVAALAQEYYNQKQTGLSINPLLISPGSGTTIGNTILQARQLKGYRLQVSSEMKNIDIFLKELTTDYPNRDFYGAPVKYAGKSFAGISSR